MALPIIGSACPDLSSALKLERLRSLAEAGISKEMLQETESNYLPLCKRFAVSPWFFERDIPNVARLRQHQPEATPGNYVWIQNESRVYQLMVRLLVRGYSDLISVNTGTSLFIQYQRPFRTPAEIRRQKALSSKDLWSFKLLNTHALDNLTRQVWLSMEYGTIYHFEACVVIRPPRLPSYVGRRKTELLGSSDIYWHKERKLEALRTLLPDLITYFAFKRLSVHSQSGSVQLRFFLKETSMRDIDLSDSLVRDRLDQLTDRRVQSLPPIKKPDGLEELGFEHHRVPEWDEGEMYSIPDEA